MMIDIHSKYDNMHKNEIFYALVSINNLVIRSISCMLSKVKKQIQTTQINFLVNPLDSSLMDTMWPISQTHFHLPCLCLLK